MGQLGNGAQDATGSDGATSPVTAVASLRRLMLDKGYERREEAFGLSSGGTSHDYVDLRRAVAHGPDLELAAAALLETLRAARLDFDALGGLTMGADPVAHVAAVLSGKSWFSVRKAEKHHGSRRRVEGAELGPGVRAVVFEDTVSTGRSLLEALEVVEATGASIVAVCALLDRGTATATQLSGRPFPYLVLLTYADLGIEPLAGPKAAPS